MADTGLSTSHIVPDFSVLALELVDSQCRECRQHIQAYVSKPGKKMLQQLHADVVTMQQTLVLLDRPAAVMAVGELIALLAAMGSGNVDDSAESAHALVLAGEQLTDYITFLQRDGATDSVLPLLPVLNNCRACRGEPLLSEHLVLAAGIKLPDQSMLPFPGDVDLATFVNQVRQSRQILMNGLLGWYRGDDAFDSSLSHLSRLFNQLAESCDAPTLLQPLVPLFDAAEFLCFSVQHATLDNSAALKKLFAQLERLLDGYRHLKVDDEDAFRVLVPADLFRNLLYYVAQSTSTTPKAVALRRRFQLGRFINPASFSGNMPQQLPGVGDRLADSIRDSIDVETEALRQWLEQAANDQRHPDALKLRNRLLQLEPALSMMGAQPALLHLAAINQSLAHMAEQPDENTASVRLNLAELLVRLNRALDADRVANRLRVGQLPSNVADATANQAQHSCLAEARRRLSLLEERFVEPSSVSSTWLDIANQLQVITRSLAVLPLPEAGLLLTQMSDLLKRGCFDQWHRAAQEAFAMAFVTLDYYLFCVLQPHAAASHLLAGAAQAISDCEELLAHDRTESADAEAIDATQELVPDDKVMDELIDQVLRHMEVISDQLTKLRRLQSDDVDRAKIKARQQPLEEIKAAYVLLSETSVACQAGDIHQLATGNILLLDALNADRLTPSTVSLLEESVAVLPQLIDQLHGSSDKVQGLSQLLDELSVQAALFNNNALLNLSTGVAEENEDITEELVTLTLDNTLRHVFYQECAQHIDTLATAVESALTDAPPIDTNAALPTEDMLRALHTLTGSAQTVDAQPIVNIVQPLQRAVLHKQRVANTFDYSETVYIGECVAALRARLQSMESGHEVAAQILDTEHRLAGFANRAASMQDSGLATRAPKSVDSLSAIFEEEARELLTVMRLDGVSRTQILGSLHTLKGSARMAHYGAVAEKAHSLEADLQECEDDTCASVIVPGLADLQQLLLAQSVQEPTSPVADTMQLTEATFERMLSLATDASVSQARLGECLSQLREAYCDLESTTERLRGLPRDNVNLDTPAAEEMLADLDSARHALAAALREAEKQQMQGSRADSTLQQALIRAQLTQIGECRAELQNILDDAAAETDRQVTFDIIGAELTLDRTLYRRLLPALEHLVRNAVVHGIESVQQRQQAKKMLTGHVRLAVDIDGSDLVLRLSDDGAGIDKTVVNKVRTANNKQPVSTASELRDALCEPGFSTRATADQLGGHGLGLAAVMQLVADLNGTMFVATDPGEGTTIVLRLPQKVVVNQVVLVRCGNAFYAIPVNFVHSVHTETADSGENATVFQGREYRTVELHSLLDSAAVEQQRDATSLPRILVEANTELLAITVDRVLGYREIIAQPLGPQLAALQRFVGGSVLADGKQVLILDLYRMVQPGLAEALRNRAKLPSSANGKTALVVDDSPTLRVAAERMLRDRGMHVRLARNGAEALVLLREQLPDVLLVDIEMPRLNGFDLLRHLRMLYPQHQTPVIVVSTRNTTADRKEAQSLGAGGYLNKPYSSSALHEVLMELGVVVPDIALV